MRADIDRLMEERGVDCIFVRAAETEDTDRQYLTRGIHANATVVKKRGEDPILIVSGMEIDEAKKSGYPVMNMFDFDLANIWREHAGDGMAIQREFFRAIIEKLDIHGRVAFYGTAPVMSTFKFTKMVQEHFSDRIELFEDEDVTILTHARRSKDEEELALLRESGRRASLAMTRTREWLSTLHTDGEIVVDAENKPVTIGDVKRYVRLRLMELDMEDSEGMIFAMGRDAGVPHSRGEADQVLKTGQTIVFDLFPRPIGGGYYHDMTRTWSLGYATPEVQAAYDLVMHAFTQSLEALTLGKPTNTLQHLVCDIFEAYGHPTSRSQPATSSGYTHSLGHGIGLDVHEAPNMSHLTPDHVVFQVGDVLTIEPGLYYPEKGWGIRVEDTVYLHESGQVENLTDCSYELVIPLNEK
ncbi:MAG: hypothetical protein CUN55_03055 [Phototrophicales bacterium]|nr:MAG: hypothetical protein CUN55_03055 [Phototrophicales bacterium]